MTYTITPFQLFQYGLGFAGSVLATGLVVILLLVLFFSMVAPQPPESDSSGAAVEPEAS